MDETKSASPSQRSLPSPSFPDFADNTNSNNNDKTSNSEIIYSESDVKDNNTLQIIVYFNIMRVDNIKLNEESFYADFDLILLWEPKDKNTNRINKLLNEENNDNTRLFENDSLKFLSKLVQFNNAIDIDVRFQNEDVMGLGKETPYGEVLKLPEKFRQKCDYSQYKSKQLKYVKYHVTATFKERFELKNFPMDVQDLSMTMFCPQHNSNVEMIQICNVYDDYDEIERKLFGSWMSRMEIGIRNELDEYDVLECYVIRTGSGWDNYDFRIKISRNYLVYFWKVGIYMFLLNISSIGVFCMNHEDTPPADQLSLLFTLLLTGIALQFVVSSWLPKLSYLTLLDKYILLSFIEMFFVITIVFILDIFEIDLDSGSSLKITLSLIIIILFVLSQIICLGMFIKKRNEEFASRQEERTDKDIKFAGAVEKFVPLYESVVIARPIERLKREEFQKPIDRKSHSVFSF